MLHSLKIIALVATCSLVMNACTYNSEEDLYLTTSCDTVDMSYSQDILPIIRDNCYSCHSQSANFGNVTLEGYNVLNTYVSNKGLLGTIRHEPGFSPMPQNRAMLIECQIEKIEAWIDQGALNN